MTVQSKQAHANQDHFSQNQAQKAKSTPAQDRSRIKRTLIKLCLDPIIAQERRSEVEAVIALAAFPLIIVALRYLSDLGWWATIGAAVGGEFLIFALFGLSLERRERKGVDKAWDNFERVFPEDHRNRQLAIDVLREFAQSGTGGRSTAATSLLAELGEDVLHDQSVENQLEEGLRPLNRDSGPSAEPYTYPDAETKRSPSPDLDEIEYTPPQSNNKKRRSGRQYDYIPLDPKSSDDD